MNGAESLVRTAIASGIEVCFANPGTTEIPLVQAFDSVPGVRLVLGLFEGVCTGAADGYGRMLDRPAMTLLHLGPGFANGIAYLHNAKRARTPLVNVIGEHATWHREADAPLAMDIKALTGTVSGWHRTGTSADSLAADLTEAVAEARFGMIASVVAPHDFQLQKTGPGIAAPKAFRFESPDERTIEQGAAALRKRSAAALMLGGRALRRAGLLAAAKVQAVTGCDLLAEMFPPFMERGPDLPRVERLPYFPEPAKALLSRYETVVFVGSREPVTFFGYPGIESWLLSKDQEKMHLAGARQNAVEVLEALAEALGGATGRGAGRNSSLGAPTGTLTPEKFCATMARIQPEDAIVIDEGLTSTFPYYQLSGNAPAHCLTTIVGGAIGYGMPCSIGAALACPDRPVINFQADGSGMYTVQSLWTMARERLNITTLVCNNRGYNIVRIELERAGVKHPGPAARAVTDFTDPPIDWVKMAGGLGVPGVTVTTVEDLVREFGRAATESGPHLIEVLL